MPYFVYSGFAFNVFCWSQRVASSNYFIVQYHARFHAAGVFGCPGSIPIWRIGRRRCKSVYDSYIIWELHIANPKIQIRCWVPSIFPPIGTVFHIGGIGAKLIGCKSSFVCVGPSYAVAGIAPSDVDVAEVHDATAFCEIYQSEMLGFCDIGKGGAFVESGATGPGGTVPINTSGGLVSKGHPVGATGLSMVYELVTQLRGEAGERQVPNARIGLAENGGGVVGLEEAACAITILERCD